MRESRTAVDLALPGGPCEGGMAASSGHGGQSCRLGTAVAVAVVGVPVAWTCVTVATSRTSAARTCLAMVDGILCYGRGAAAAI